MAMERELVRLLSGGLLVGFMTWRGETEKKSCGVVGGWQVPDAFSPTVENSINSEGEIDLKRKATCRKWYRQVHRQGDYLSKST